MRKQALLIGAMAGAAFAFGVAPASAAPLYFQGFESDTAGWHADTGGAINRVASGTAGIPAFDGSFYGDVQNARDQYLPGYGSGGFSWFEGNGSTPPPYPGSGFSESISAYINVTTPPPTDAADAGFSISMTPSSITSDGVGCYPAACSDEQLFRLFYSGSSVNVEINGTTVQTIGTSGWYTFQITYQKGATPTSLVTNEMNIFNASGNLLSSTAASGDMEGGTLESSNLAGPGYVWLPQWQDGFSGDHLAIDDVRADAIPTPEPASLALLGAGLCLFGFVTRKRWRKGS